MKHAPAPRRRRAGLLLAVLVPLLLGACAGWHLAPDPNPDGVYFGGNELSHGHP